MCNISFIFAENCNIMEENKKQERSVTHLYLKENDTHFYFGSVANVFEHFTKDEIGITFGSLRNYGLSASNPYENKKVIIRKGILLAKPKKSSN
jgi:hypothetical protein